MSEETKRIISRKYICKGCFMPCVLEVGMEGYIPKCCILELPANYSRYVPWEPLVTGEQFVKDHSRPMAYEEKKKWVESKERIMKLGEEKHE